MTINIDKFKKDINIKSMSDNFYRDMFFEELSSYCYAEKCGKIFYKVLKEKELWECEKKHYSILKNILKDNLKPINKVLYDNFISFFKSKNEKIIKSLLASAEYYSLIRYKTIIQYIEDTKVIKALSIIIDDEEKHITSIDENTLEFKNIFMGYNNIDLYEKYKNELNISYSEFKELILNSVFFKKLKGEIRD